MPTSSRYGVPVPLNIDPTDHARYLTDVVIMDPICNWTVPTDPLVAYDGYYDKPQMTFKLPEFGILVQMFHSTLALQGNKRKALYVAGYYELSNHILNSTTLDPDTSGSMAWIISQCTSCTESNEDTGFDDNTDQSKLDLSELPTAVYSFGVNGTNTSYTVQYSILVCNPRILIETREVVLDGTGRIEVLESTGLTAQGNLHLLQTHLLVGNGLAGYSTESGPETSFNDVGRAGQVKMFFGPILDDPTPTLVLKPQPVEKITNEFTLAQQAALRTYLSGVFGTSYVPGRVQITKLVFTSSLPHIIVSTILFAAVTLFVIICHLRPSMKQFTLYSIATVMARSNAGAVFEDAKYAGCTQGDGLSEEMAIKLIEDRRVYLTNSGGPGPSLYIE